MAIDVRIRLKRGLGTDKHVIGTQMELMNMSTKVYSYASNAVQKNVTSPRYSLLEALPGITLARQMG